MKLPFGMKRIAISVNPMAIYRGYKKIFGKKEKERKDIKIQDWICLECNNINHHWTPVCLNCNIKRNV